MGFDELPHEFRARPADDGEADTIEFRQRLLHFPISGYVNDQIDFLRLEQFLVVADDRNAIELRQAKTRRFGIDLGDSHNPDQRIAREDRQQGRTPGTGPNDRNPSHRRQQRAGCPSSTRLRGKAARGGFRFSRHYFPMN